MPDDHRRDCRSLPDANPFIIDKEENTPPPNRSRRGPTRAAERQMCLAEQYIRENIYNPITIADITAKTGINIRALQRLYRKYHNATPIQVLANYRIAAARAMILDGQVTSVRHLAAKLHFSNPGRFSKLYRTTYSCTPSEHIRAISRSGQ
ncbi:hypothetical protein CU102_21305 [Phyllobacterium brassicacearum]|uniref:HTH araC/xylS-type domain-containing protein n=2 Tax=Phyllobacterium brassicacearum TaxID=314235 RepID=A0A2P7BE84_9HYPH|nr:hypothetical protein CU102_21305 [Phyllobacterium brassicacearum]TDQ21760.1 AraC-like DNA-binding protein [Phyllobacterium brassicacearum]